MLDTMARERSAAAYAHGALCGLAAVSIWAGNIIVGSLGLRASLTAWDITAIRFAVAGLLLAPLLARSGLALDRLGWLGVAALILGGAPTVLLANAGLLLRTCGSRGSALPRGHAADDRRSRRARAQRVIHAFRSASALLSLSAASRPSYGGPASHSARRRRSGTCCFSGPRWRSPATRSLCAGPASTAFMRQPSPPSAPRFSFFRRMH